VLEFAILFAAAFAGGIAVLPYSFRLVKGAARRKPSARRAMSPPAFAALALFQSAVVSAITIGVGLLAAHAIGLGAPYVEAATTGRALPSIVPMLEASCGFGACAGALLLVLDLGFLPSMPATLVETARKISLWENFAASFYGGINEELLTRLFGLSGAAWLLSRLWHTQSGTPTLTDLWAANAVMAILFGLGHLPALKGLVGKITPPMLTRSLLLNALIGLLCGWLFWTFGIEAAMIAHFAADVVYHVGGTALLRRIVPVPGNAGSEV
jgi:hypothetical protein